VNQVLSENPIHREIAGNDALFFSSREDSTLISDALIHKYTELSKNALRNALRHEWLDHCVKLRQIP